MIGTKREFQISMATGLYSAKCKGVTFKPAVLDPKVIFWYGGTNMGENGDTRTHGHTH